MQSTFKCLLSVCLSVYIRLSIDLFYLSVHLCDIDIDSYILLYLPMNSSSFLSTVSIHPSIYRSIYLSRMRLLPPFVRTAGADTNNSDYARRSLLSAYAECLSCACLFVSCVSCVCVCVCVCLCLCRSVCCVCVCVCVLT